MACKCRICCLNEVDNPGDICELCAIGQDPYATGLGGNHISHNNVPLQSAPVHSGYAPKRTNNRKVLINGTGSVVNTDPYGNDMTPSQVDAPVQVYSAGQVPNQAVVQNTSPDEEQSHTEKGTNQPVTTGITKNVTVDNHKISVLEKWFRALFKGTYYPLDDEITMFQVFPDYTGTSVNAMGNACDQVIVYGKLNNGEVSENNEVEVYGRRDSHNNIIARKIKNKASGTTIKPQRCIGPGVVWFITMMVLLLIVTIISGLGLEGIIWVVVFILCLTNMPLIFKILFAILGGLFSLIKRLF